MSSVIGHLRRIFGVMCALLAVVWPIVMYPAAIAGAGDMGGFAVRRVAGDLFCAEVAQDEELCARYAEIFDESVILDSGVSRDDVMPWFSRIPIGDAETFRESGWHMHVGHGDNAVEEACDTEQDVLGMCVPIESTLYVEDSEMGLRFAVIHEMGHFIDLSRGNPTRRSDEWVEIFDEEMGSFVDVGRFDDYAQTDAIEFFAEVYRTGVMYPTTTRLSAPKAYAYVFGG